MGAILVSATLLILMVMILRWLSRGRIRMCFRYALWLMVVLRLIVPVSFGSSSFSVLNLMPRWPDNLGNVTMPHQSNRHEDRIVEDAAERPGEIADDVTKATENAAGGIVAADYLRENGTDRLTASLISGSNGLAGEGEKIWQIQDILQLDFITQLPVLRVLIWIGGTAIVGGYMLINHFRFTRYLQHMRTIIVEEDIPKAWRSRLAARKMRVYLIAGLPSPCLAGRDIYIGPQILKERDKLEHVLAHEYAHALQGDRLWSFLRSVLCAVYWFYPLIWLASFEAKKDSELACDERAIGILGESERFAYGRTLISLLSCREERGRYAGAVLIMGGKKNSVKERIFMIAKKKETSRVVAALVALTAAITCGCTFTGAAARHNLSGNGQEILLVNEGSLMHKDVEETTPKQDEQEKRDAEFGQEEWEESTINQKTDRRRWEENEHDLEDVKALAVENAAFEEALYRAEDSELASAVPMNLAEYYDYLYEGAEAPMTDGQWYQLHQEEETDIEFYGLYTQKYGFRGLKIKIGDDVGTFDQPWLPTSFGIDVDVLEVAEKDGLPRSFVFKACVVNSRDNEIWRLYVVDRYDTGIIELHCFEAKDFWDQLEEYNVILRVVQEEQKVNLICDGNRMAGSIDISKYADEAVEKAVWDESSVGYRLDEGGEGQIKVMTGIGLKSYGSDDMFYQGLPLVAFPVEIGNFGNRSFTLGVPSVDEEYFSGRLNK